MSEERVRASLTKIRKEQIKYEHMSMNDSIPAKQSRLEMVSKESDYPAKDGPTGKRPREDSCNSPLVFSLSVRFS